MIGSRLRRPAGRAGAPGVLTRRMGAWKAGGARYCLAAGLAAAGLAGGCGDATRGEGGRLSPRIVPFLEGVAVPTGFKWVDKRSEDDLSGGVRFARHEYAGSAGLHAVREFYREQMPLLGWNKVADQNIKGRITLRFEKHSEECTVEITSGGLFNRTKIQVIVKPFTRKRTEPPRRPVP